jgi:SAM-dependent methyltransferase
MTMSAANEEQARYWNGDEAVHWLSYESRYEAMLGPFTDRLLEAVAISPTDRVLDVGCGCGSTTRAVGRRAPEGAALGVDISRRLLQRAEHLALQEDLGNVRFEHADSQVHQFSSEAFDAAVSRFGTMFFADPVAAFTNIGRALRLEGRIAFVCWAEPLENEWIVVPGVAAAEHLAVPDHVDPDSPGPFALANEDRLAAILDRAGLVEVSIEAVSEPLLLGSDVTDTVEFLAATGFGQRLLGGVDRATRSRVTSAWEAALLRYRTADGIRLRSKAWLVTGRRPAGRVAGR